ncbi:type III-A CRISPR-associated protein Cas10/Csm1 [Clostridium sp.]|uniref:type III-A CRISPR-associated protein Cas10/Csm1 n=1 Tax=Clostridium sp. TaxID=1506 RepID=UPI002FDCFC7F
MEEFFYVLSKYLQDINIIKNDKLYKFLNKYMTTLNKDAEIRKILDHIYKKFLDDEVSEYDSNNKIYSLNSIFSGVNLDYKIKLRKSFYKNPVAQSLSDQYIYPNENNIVSKETFKKNIDSFIDEIDICKNKEQILYIFKKYFSSIPVKNSSKCYISLFNAAKIISAFYLYTKNFKFKGKIENQEFLLLKADVSGIQEFIFNISSKEAVKSLKGRSVYISLLTDIISKYIIKRLNLTTSNILYNGGGNFYILIPKSRAKEIIEIRRYISKILLKAHKGKIYIAIETSDQGSSITIDKINDISKFFEDVSEKVALLKNKKWSDIGIKENFQYIFGPIDTGNYHKNICSICGSTISNSNDKMCEMCKSFSNLTDEVKVAKIYYEEEVYKDSIDNVKDIKNYKDVFNRFGFNVQFNNINSDNKLKKYLINDTDFLRNNCDGYVFKAFNLPQESTFEKIVSFNNDIDNEGDKKLGVLKLDVDNLGKIFIKGLKTTQQDKVSLGKIIELSDAISIFFEGYLNELIKDNNKKALIADIIKGKNWDKVMYTVYAGGDDTFILGAYNEVFEFAYILRKSFEKYTCNNSNITFSAGLGLFPYKYPVIKCANYTEQFLDDAKMYIRKNRQIPDKNSVSLFGDVFTWVEFEKILEIRNLCIDIYKTSKNRAFLQKVLNSTKGFRSIMRDISSKEKIQVAKVHRLAYYLRELRNSKVKNYVEELIKIYEKMIIESILNSNNVYNIMVIPAAVRWAELNTKK